MALVNRSNYNLFHLLYVFVACKYIVCTVELRNNSYEKLRLTYTSNDDSNFITFSFSELNYA
jgi:hypothetical protein